MTDEEKYLQQLEIIKNMIEECISLYENSDSEFNKRPAAIALVYSAEIKLATHKRDLIINASKLG
jgi:hypothetical protein